MSSVSGGATVIVDKDGGDAVTVTGSRLDVNAYLSATPTIDIGDVSLLLGGTAASVNNGSADATTLRVTVADDSTGVLSIDDNGGSLTIDDGGSSITVDGTVTVGSVPAPLSVTGDGARSGTLRVTLANDSARFPGYSTIGHGKNDAVSSSTAEALTTSTACKHVDVMAAIANTGIIYVGGSSVAANTGIALYPGDVYSIDIDDLTDVYVLASVNNEDVQWVYFN